MAYLGRVLSDLISLYFSGQVYKRLVSAMEQLEGHFEFAHNQKYGVVTSCPSNLGTTLRASVHMRLPLLSQDRDKLNTIAAEHSLQIRGTGGEHSEIVDGVMDISNKRRLGITEYDLIQSVQLGIQALIDAEEALSTGTE